MTWKCALCSFTAVLLLTLIGHLKQRHSEFKGSIRCSLNGCEKDYKRVSSFAAHAHERHAAFLQCCGPTEAGGEPVFLIPDDEPGTLRY